MRSKILGFLANAALCLAPFFASRSPLARAQDAGPAAAPNPVRKSASLLPEDKLLLERLLKDFVFDPKGAKFVVVAIKTQSVEPAGRESEIGRQGWLIPASGKQPARVYRGSDDCLMTVPSGAKIENLDFLALCRKRYGAAAKPAPVNGPVYGPADDFQATPDLIHATWLHRIGEDGLASEALERAREQVPNPGEPIGKPAPPTSDAEMVASVQEKLATADYQRLIQDFMVRADEAALAEGQRLLKRFPKQAAQLAQPAAILADLERRRKKGSFGKAPPQEAPADFGDWNVAKKLAYWMDALDEVDIRQQSRPGYGDLLGDRRIAALIELGDAAVPALIDAIENDDRQTRSVFDSFENEPRPILLSVRQAAFITVMAILRVRVFRPGIADRAMTPKGAEDSKPIAEALRAYWKINGRLPFEARMMKQLTDLKASRTDWRDAAGNLADPQTPRIVMGGGAGNAVWSAGLLQEPPKPSPAVLKFTNPTAAEAMLAALDRDLAAGKARPVAAQEDPNPFVHAIQARIDDRERREVEDAYMLPIKQLRDHRIAPELARRYALATTVRTRCQLALAAHVCGDSEPLKRFCRDLEQGKLELPRISEITAKIDWNTDSALRQGVQDLSEIIMSLIESNLPQADKALLSLADPKHPQHKFAVRILLGNELADNIHLMPSAGYFFDSNAVERHPYSLAVLRSEFDNVQQTGGVVRRKGDQIETSGGSDSFGSSPNDLGDQCKLRQQASVRICDVAAAAIRQIAWGMPATHPLYKDFETRLAAMKQVLDRYKSRFRAATPDESESLAGETMLILAWPPLGRPATAADIAKGQAIFELGGKGKLAPLKLPAVGTLPVADPTQAPTQNVLILQAEIGPDGKTLYGIVGENILRSIPADQLTDVKPLEPSQPK